MNFFKLVPARSLPTQKTSVAARNSPETGTGARRIANVMAVAATLVAGLAPAVAAKAGRDAPVVRDHRSGDAARKHPCYYGPCPRPIVRDHRTGSNPQWVPQQRR
jgi:hypothetical protein